MAPHDRDQFVEIERLLEIDVRAGIEAADPVLDKRPGGKHDDRDFVSLPADRLADGVAAHAGEHDVEDQQVERRRFGGQCGQRRLAIGGGLDLEALGLEVELDADGEVVFVFDDENARHGVGPGEGKELVQSTRRGPCVPRQRAITSRPRTAFA